jgi:tetratricopeptide (TPR) repeat protein
MPAMLTTRAAALNEMSRHAEALEDARKAIALEPAQPRPYLERAIARENMNEAPESALADYKRAAALDPSFTADYTSALARLAAISSAQSAQAAGAKPSAASGRPGLAAELIRDAWNLQPRAVGLGAFVLLVLAAGGYALLRR